MPVDCVVLFLVILAAIFLVQVCPDMPQSYLSVQHNLSYHDRQDTGCVIRYDWENRMFRLAMPVHTWNKKTKAKITRKRTTQSTGTVKDLMTSEKFNFLCQIEYVFKILYRLAF